MAKSANTYRGYNLSFFDLGSLNDVPAGMQVIKGVHIKARYNAWYVQIGKHF